MNTLYRLVDGHLVPYYYVPVFEPTIVKFIFYYWPGSIVMDQFFAAQFTYHAFEKMMEV